MNPRSLEIITKRVYRGPNRYSYGRGIAIEVDIGDLELEPTGKIEGFNEGLLDLIPTLHTHTCSYDQEGGFVRRLTEEDGTWMGHVFEHIAIEIQNLAGVKVSHGKTRQIKNRKGRTDKASIYRVYFELKNEETGLAASELAKKVVNWLIDNSSVEDFDYNKELIEVIEIAEEYSFGPSTGSIVDEARSRGIPAMRLRKTSSLVQFGWGINQKRIWASTSTESRYIAVEIAQDKELTLQMLYDVGIPVPKGGTARRLSSALAEAHRTKFPVVIKPLNVSHGRGISLNVNNEAELKVAYELAKEYSRTVIVEKFLEGKDYRILVINGKFVAAANRIPAHVYGDGVLTIQQLVDEVNKDPRRGIGHEKVLTQIKINESALRMLSDQGYQIDSIPEKGKFVQLVSTGNMSTGGTAIDVTDIIHYDNIKLAERAVKTIGLDIAGIDIIAPDISKPIKTHGGAIIEINAAPGLRMHLEPTEGINRNVARPIVDMLFPDNSNGRIPLIAVTGTNGKTTTSRWIAHTLKLAGYKVGLTTTDGIYIDGEVEYTGDCTGPWSAKVVLRDPTVDFAVLETARGGILREGLGWDFCDVGMILNVSDDHLGKGGVDTVEELAEVKAVVYDQVKESGWGIINADDPLVVDQLDRIDGEVVLVSLSHENPILLEHTKNGKTSVTVTPNGVIQLIQGGSQTPIIHLRDIPSTFKGRAVFNIQNALFVVASLTNYLSINDIKTGLSTFYTDRNQVPGRMNVERIKGGRVIIDYGHNNSALQAQIQLIEGLWHDQGKIGRKAIVIGMPGDRSNSSLVKAIKGIAGKYDRYFIKEDWNLRKRAPGEIANLINETLLTNQVKPEEIEIFSKDKTELDAVKAMYEWMNANDIIILQADDIGKVQKYLLKELAKIRVDDTSIQYLSDPSTDTEDEPTTYDFSSQVAIKDREDSD
ncbi:MAG: Cyanophycin synthetase [Candidatus Heimdallarchaeota archaeon LC_2]|nr:MAG: Cyanophycin synthetase [Candidatus Heimdallarchaeota archaeon LC_2]